MDWRDSKIVLAALVLVLATIMLCRLQFRAYSPKELRDELAALCQEYADLRARGADEAEWQAFEQKAQEITEPMVADMEKHLSEGPLKRQELYALARYYLPEAIQSRGRWTEDFVQKLAQEHTRTVGRVGNRGNRARSIFANVDFVTVGMVLLDGVLVVAIGYMFFWPVRERIHLLKGGEAAIEHLNDRLAKNPQSVRYLGVRAKLLAKAGRHEEAIADIDSILVQQPRGVNLDKWRRFRESVVEQGKAEEAPGALRQEHVK